MKYNILYADPPWQFDQGIKTNKTQYKGRGYTPDTTCKAKYKTQTLDWIKKIPIQKISANDAVLFLWTTDAHLGAALEVIQAWNFKYTTIAFIWNKKEKSGKQVCYFGRWTMKGSEICLLATKGKIHSYIVSHKVRQLVEATRDRTVHSQKPNEIRERIEHLMGDLPRIELFAREKHTGWTTIGYEIDNKDLYLRINEISKEEK